MASGSRALRGATARMTTPISWTGASASSTTASSTTGAAPAASIDTFVRYEVDSILSHMHRVVCSLRS